MVEGCARSHCLKFLTKTKIRVDSRDSKIVERSCSYDSLFVCMVTAAAFVVETLLLLLLLLPFFPYQSHCPFACIFFLDNHVLPLSLLFFSVVLFISVLYFLSFTSEVGELFCVFFPNM